MVRLQAVTLSTCTNSELAGQHDSPAMKLWPGGMVLYEVCRTRDFKGTPERQVRRPLAAAAVSEREPCLLPGA